MSARLPDEEFVFAFENCMIPAAEWHHREHVRLAYLYLRQYPFATALERMREKLKQFNAATKTPESLERGYHETMTVAWLRLVQFTLSQCGPTASSDEFLDAQEHLLNRKALRYFYSKERLISWQAKAAFVEPDLTNFPRVSTS